MQVLVGGPLEMTAILWVPFYALVLMRALRRPTTARWLAAGSALTLTTLASSYYGLFLAVYTAAHVALALPRRRPTTDDRRPTISGVERSDRDAADTWSVVGGRSSVVWCSSTLSGLGRCCCSAGRRATWTPR
jgi:hypothetical protein